MTDYVTEPTRANKVKVLTDELTMWVNTRFLLETRLQANLRLEKLGMTSAADVDGIKKELERCQAMISFYEEQISALPAPTVDKVNQVKVDEFLSGPQNGKALLPEPSSA